MIAVFADHTDLHFGLVQTHFVGFVISWLSYSKETSLLLERPYNIHLKRGRTDLKDSLLITRCHI